MWCALSSYSSHNKSQASARQKKRHREDIEVSAVWSQGLARGSLCTVMVAGGVGSSFPGFSGLLEVF